MAARFMPLDHERIDTVFHEFLRERHRRGKTHHLSAPFLQFRDDARLRQPASQHHVADLLADTDIGQFFELRMHGDQIYTKLVFSELFRRFDLGL